MTKPNINVEGLEWQPHKTAKGVEMKLLISKVVQATDVTCMLVRIGRGLEVPEHIHENSDDILYSSPGRPGWRWRGARISRSSRA